MIIYGDDADDGSGWSVSSGDINGDGYDDVIIGAYGADPATGRANAGESYVIFGSAAPPATIDLNDSPSPADIIIYGDDAYDESGGAVSSGDINGDGCYDVVIGAYKADPSVGLEAGETYVIFGSAAPPATVDLSSVSADMTIYGDDVYDESGYSVSSGDINGDGCDDVIIGARFADPAGGSAAGETYVIFGSAAPPATVDLNSVSADITIYGDDADDWSGYSVSSGDINSDGCDDVIVGAWGADQAGGANMAGETYVIFGSDLPIDCDFTTTDISGWQKMGTGKAILKYDQLLMKLTTSYLRLFPTGAVCDECDIETKVTYQGGTDSTAKSSIFFGYQDRRNYWELRIQFAGSNGKWILQRRAGKVAEKYIYSDTINRGQQYHIKIEVRGEYILIFVDGERKLGILMMELPAWGNIALEYRGAGKCWFDDLAIY